MTITQWSDDILVKLGATVSQYNETNTRGTTYDAKVNGAWQFIGTTTLVMPIGRGYKVSVGLDNSADLMATVGKPQIGSHPVAVSYTAAGTQGWNLVGNPYPCEIDWDLVYADNNQLVEPNLYMMDPYNSTFSNTTYFIYNALTGISTDPRRTDRPDDRTNIIASSQGFFVKARSTINSLPSRNMAFRETHKPTSFGAVYPNLREQAPIPQIKITLSEGATPNTGQTVLAFDSRATDDFDDYDATPLSEPSIYTTVTGETKLSINTLTWPRTEVNVPLFVKPTLGTKSFTITTMTATGFNYFIYDDFLGTSTAIVQGTVIPFEFTSNTATTRADRFRIVTTPLTTSTIEVTTDGNSGIVSTGLVLSPNPTMTGKLELSLYGAKAGTADVEILDSRGILVYRSIGVATRKTSFGADTHIDFGDLPAGVYAVRCTHAGGSNTQRLVVTK
jgi:hypothetical protein